MGSKSNSNSNPWDDFESFPVKHESLEDWMEKIIKFDRIDRIAKTRGKTVEYQTYLCPDGTIITHVTCQ